MEIVGIGMLDPHRRNFPDAQRPVARNMNRAIDLRGIALAAALSLARSDFVDDDLFAMADPAFEALMRNGLLVLH